MCNWEVLDECNYFVLLFEVNGVIVVSKILEYMKLICAIVVVLDQAPCVAASKSNFILVHMVQILVELHHE